MDFFLKEIRSFLVNEIYAVDPSAIKDSRDFGFLLELFGFSRGRFIAEYPCNWHSFLQREAREMPPLDQARMCVLLQRFKAHTLPSDVTYLTQDSWLCNALKQRAQFTKIVTTPNDEGLPSLEDILCQELADSQGGHISRDVITYEAIIRPLFLTSTEIHIQDKYFNFRDKRKLDVMHMLFKLCAIHGRCTSLVFHLGEEEREHENLSLTRIDTGIESLKAQYPALTLSATCMWDGGRTHGRYIFSTKGGLHFDHGFDTDDGKPNRLRLKNHVHWMSRKELLPLLERYGI